MARTGSYRQRNTPSRTAPDEPRICVASEAPKGRAVDVPVPAHHELHPHRAHGVWRAELHVRPEEQSPSRELPALYTAGFAMHSKLASGSSAVADLMP